MPLQIETRQERTVTIIRLVGSILSQDGASDLKASLGALVQQGHYDLLLEVFEVSRIDELGVETLRSLQEEATQAGGDLKLAGARFSLLAGLALYDVKSNFPYYDNTERALAAFPEYQESNPKGVKHFDILEFVKEQEKEEQEQTASGSAELSQESASKS